jgi:hypothetical protein
MIVGNANRLAIAARQRGRFRSIPLTVHGADGVDDVFRGQSASGGQHGLTSRQLSDLRYDRFALLENRRPTGTMDGPVYAATAQQV